MTFDIVCHLNGLNVKLPLAICGLGRFATRRILPAIAQCPCVELVAVVDHSGKARDIPLGVRRFASLEDYLETKPVGAIHITSPNFLHAQHTLQCLTAGLHVICEKPMATNSVDCQYMIKAARDFNLQLWVGHMLRYSPALLLARQWLQNGSIGELLSINAIFHYELAEISRTWAFRADRTGGGALMDAGIHCIDVIRLFTAEPIKVLTASRDSRSHEDGVERKATCRLAAGEVKCLVDVNSQAPYKTLLTISGTGGEIVIDNFAASWGEVAVKLYAYDGGEPVKEELVDVSTIYSEQLRNFAKAIAQPELVAFQDIFAAENVKIAEELYAIS
jgi:predicted dehydrogenase